MKKPPAPAAPDNEIVVKIQGVLKALPHVKKIYVKETGEYQFAAVDGFKEFSRNQILGIEVDDEDDDLDENFSDEDNGGEPAAPAAPAAPAQPAAAASQTEGENGAIQF